MDNKICIDCESPNAKLKTYTPGSFALELVLWLMFILPGFIYSIYRLAARKKVCAVCGSSRVVPLNSPKGQEILKRKMSQI